MAVFELIDKLQKLNEKVKTQKPTTKDQLNVAFTSLKQAEQKLNEALEHQNIKDGLVIIKAKEILDITSKTLRQLSVEMRYAS